jgi:hypothetical protein
MQGDYSRVTFDPKRQFTMVLMQQGRVLLDADYNEQTAILLHYLRQLAADVIGPHGGPASDLGFQIFADGAAAKIDKLKIGAGRYWVDGLLCENEAIVTYSDPQNAEVSKLGATLLAYLDVWERHITSVEDPRIREVALGGPDTSARAQVVWRVQFVKISANNTTPLDCLHFETSAQWNLIANPNPGMLTASTDQGTPPTTPCIASPDARYRGENQLYRVEIHQGGDKDTATFKWSRENASVVFPIESIADALVTVEHLGRDDRFGLEIGDFVEVVNDDTSLDAQSAAPEQLFEVIDINTTELIVTLNGAPKAGGDSTKHPFLRRWDQQAGNAEHHGLTLTNGAAKIVEDKLLNLEDGIQILFKLVNAVYRRGDYWLIPARATGDIEWPGGPQRPHGVGHHYAPLAIVDSIGGKVAVTDLRHIIDPLATCCPKIVVRPEPGTQTVTFVAVVNPPMSDLTYHWTVGGNPHPGSTANEVEVPWGNAASIRAVVVVDGLPDGCAASASATAIKNPVVKAVDDTKNTT